MRLAADWIGRLPLPLIAAPMTQVSGVELVVAACRNGVIGAFPTLVRETRSEYLPRSRGYPDEQP
jgi:nitronate monooxygenase